MRFGGDQPYEPSPLEDRRQQAREAYYDNGGAPDARGEYAPIEMAIETATRVRVGGQIEAAAYAASGYGGDISADTYRAIITAAFRAAGFEVEE